MSKNVGSSRLSNTIREGANAFASSKPLGKKKASSKPTVLGSAVKGFKKGVTSQYKAAKTVAKGVGKVLTASAKMGTAHAGYKALKKASDRSKLRDSASLTKKSKIRQTKDGKYTTK
jgi:hypothetical protein